MPDDIILSKVNNKSYATITKFSGGRASQSRLASMGLFPGSKIEIISCQNKGPVVISLNDNKIVLGRGLANKIIVNLSN